MSTDIYSLINFCIEHGLYYECCHNELTIALPAGVKIDMVCDQEIDPPINFVVTVWGKDATQGTCTPEQMIEKLERAIPLTAKNLQS